MTPDTLRYLPEAELDAVYARLSADALPVGTFAGQAWSTTLPIGRALGLLWKGKVFDGSRVRNTILGMSLIEGVVTLVEREIVITYPRLGLTDFLRPLRFSGRPQGTLPRSDAASLAGRLVHVDPSLILQGESDAADHRED